MAHKKKKPDCLVAGVLALLTAFSPVVSVIPTYAASDNEMSTSVTIDNDSSPDIDSGGGSDGSDGSDSSGTAGVVIDNSDPSGSGQSNTGQSDISIEGDQGDGIVSETIGDLTGTDGIQIEDSGDGIQVEKGQDSDGILIDPSSLSGNDVQVEQADESISVDQAMDENVESHALRFDFVGEHGLVKVTSKSDIRYIRVHENADGNKIASIYDKDRNLLYTSEVSNYVAFYQDSLPEGNAFTVEAIADYGYSVGTYSILMDSGAEDQEDVFDQTGFVADHYQKYTWDVVMNTDKSMRIAFTDSVDSDLEYENSIGLVDPKTMIDDTIQNTVSENSVSEDETDGQGFIVLSEDPTEEGHEVISSMADEVELPDITEKEEKQAIADPVYEGYVREHLNHDLVTGDDLAIVSFMHVKQTLFDDSRLYNTYNLDELMIREDISEYCLGQMETIVPLYQLDDNDDYFVAYVNTMQHDSRAKIVDWAFANANTNGESLSDCIYDKDTGLAYIPKKDALESDSVSLGKVQIQLAQMIDYSVSYTESVAVLNNPDGTLSADGFNIFTEFPSFNIGSGRNFKNLEVFVNGLPIDESEDRWEYDPATGKLLIKLSSILINSVNVRDSGKNVGFLGAALQKLFGLKTVYANISKWSDMNKIGKITSKGGVQVGDYSLMTGTLVRCYGSVFFRIPQYAGSENVYTYIPVGTATIANSLMEWIVSGGNPNSNISDPKHYKLYGVDNLDEKRAMTFGVRLSSLGVGKNAGFDFEGVNSDLDSERILPLLCAHVEHPLTGKPLRPTSDLSPSNPAQYFSNAKFGCRILAVDPASKTAVIALMSQGVTFANPADPNESGQCSFGVFAVNAPVIQYPSVRVNKNSGAGDLNGLCDDNPLYDMEGALFGVYRTESAAKNADIVESTSDTSHDKKGSPAACIGVLKAKNTAGFTNTLELDFCYDEDGNRKPAYDHGLWIRELKAPYGYDISRHIEHLSLPKKANDETYTVPFVDPPLTDPGRVSMVKVPQDTLNENMSALDLLAAMRNNTEEMNGAEYELCYYKSNAYSGLKLTKETADLTFRLKTITINGIPGRLDLSNPDCYVGNKKWPYIKNGEAQMTMGVYTLEEVKAPPGYPLKKGKMKAVAYCHRGNVVDADGTKHFEAKFNWDPEVFKKQNNSDERIVMLKDNEAGVAFAYNEPVDYSNVGIYKRDEETGLAVTGDRKFDGIEFGLIYGEENEEDMHNVLTNEDVKPGSQVPGIKLKFGKGKDYVTTESLNKGQGVLSPGVYYFIETKGNDVYLKSEERVKIVVPKGGQKGKVYYPTKSGEATTEPLNADGTLKDDVLPFENISPPMGVELDKTTWTNFGEMKSDDYILGDATYEDYIFGKQDIGDATLEGHTFAIFHTSENDIELKDGTKVKSAKDKLEDPDNPTWKELNNLYELTEGKIQENGYICDLIVTDEKGEAKTAPDAFSIGTYWVIEVATKEDYVVNNVDVGKVGGKEGVKADQLTKDGGLIKAVFEHNGETADDGACWNPPVSGGVHIQKLDEMRDDDREHGDLNLAATFKIINASKKAVKNKYGKTIPTSGLTDKPRFPTYDQVRAASETCTVYEITADKNGKADTEEHDLVYGTYYIIETAVPDGYYLNAEWVGKVEIRKDGEIVPVGEANNELHDEYNHYYYDRSQKEPVVHPDDAVACRDMPYRGGVAVQKIDKEMGWQTAQGMGTLKGAEFTILNASGSSARNVDGKDVKSVTSRKDFQETYQQLWRIANETDSPYVMQRIYTNKEGFACTGKTDLPYGTYYIIETKAPVGYWLDEEFVGKIVIRDDGRCMMIGDSDLPTANGSDFYDINDRLSDFSFFLISTNSINSFLQS